MIAPHFRRDQLIGYAMTKASKAVPATSIDKIEVEPNAIYVTLDRKRVVLSYESTYGGTLGSDDWAVSVERVEDVATTSHDSPASDSSSKVTRKFVWQAVVTAAIAGAMLATLAYDLALK